MNGHGDYAWGYMAGPNWEGLLYVGLFALGYLLALWLFGRKYGPDWDHPDLSMHVGKRGPTPPNIDSKMELVTKRDWTAGQGGA